MDLSHWDLVDYFTLDEAAHLAAGAEVHLVPMDEALVVRKDVIRSAMHSAYETAISYADLILSMVWDGVQESPFRPWHLVSVQLSEAYDACVKSDSEALPEAVRISVPTPYFGRQELSRWFNFKKFAPVYAFAKDSQHLTADDTGNVPTSRPAAHHSAKFATMLRASEKFWANADRDDRETHPENAKVSGWLVSQGFSATLADKAATILRPEWARPGRKPEN